jgi:DNA-binding beta-propeller fold protein YncE
MYVVNQGCDVVLVLDAATGLPIRAVEVGISSANDAAHAVKVSPDGRFWYVIFLTSNFMQKFRCSDDSYVGDIPLTPYAAGIGGITENAVDWNAIAISPDGKRGYLTSWTANGRISVVDLENRKFVRWIGGQHYPHGITINAAGDKLYVTAQTGNFITELDSGLTFANEIPLDGEVNYASSLDIHEILLSPDEKRALVTCQKTDEVRVVDLVTKQVQIVPAGNTPQEIVYDDVTDTYFVSCLGDTVGEGTGVVTAFDGGSLAARHLECGYQPHGIAVNKVTRELYVASRNISEGGVPPHHGSVCQGRNGFLNFVDIKTFTVKPRTFELSVDPYFIFARP